MGDSIPVIKGDGGPYWEDGLITDARTTALARSNEQRVLAAEKFSTISSLVNPVIRPDSEAMKLLWDNLRMFDEHTWTCRRSWMTRSTRRRFRQSAVKESRATNGKLLLEQCWTAPWPPSRITLERPVGTLVVFNPLNWPRSSLVEADINKGVEPVDPSTGRPPRIRRSATGEHYRRLRFLAADVPPLGYKCYALERGKARKESGREEPANHP